MKPEYLFVYGTLRPPQPGSLKMDSFNFPKVEPYLIEFHPATLSNAYIYDLGSFPGVRRGTGTVMGEILLIEPQAFNILDVLEGHPDLFKRQLEAVSSPAGVQQAWVYFAPESLVAGAPRIKNGDWLRRREPGKQG